MYVNFETDLKGKYEYIYILQGTCGTWLAFCSTANHHRDQGEFAWGLLFLILWDFQHLLLCLGPNLE